jgi:2-iminobutanoate/2-iminopropanoate deaminase
LTNLKTLAEDNGLRLSNVVKNTLYLTDMNDFTRVNAIYSKHFTGDYPARTCIAVKALPMGAKFEIESILFKSR